MSSKKKDGFIETALILKNEGDQLPGVLLPSYPRNVILTHDILKIL